MVEVLEGPLYLGIFGGVFGVFLAIANYFLKVKEDPRVEIIEKILPRRMQRLLCRERLNPAGVRPVVKSH